MRMNRKGLWAGGLLTAFLFCISASLALAMPALDVPFTLTQPDGTVFTARQGGDEWRNWVSYEGHLIVRDEDGWWRYGRVTDGALKATEARAAIERPPAETATTGDVGRLRRRAPGAPKEAMWAPAAAHKAPEYAVIILVEFSDRTLTYTSESDWCNWYFSSSGKTARTYFDEASRTLFKPIMAAETWNTANDGVIKVTLGYNHPDPGATIGDANRLIVYDALVAANPYINYAAFDTNPTDGVISANELHILTIVAGYERGYSAAYSPSVWGHRWALGWGAVGAPNLDGVSVCNYAWGGGYMQDGEIHGDHMATIGVSCHEMGHDLGMIDLYDSDASSAGIGGHGLMGYGGWGHTAGDSYIGQTPSHPCAWSKIQAGLATPDTVTANGFQTLYATDSLAYNALKILTGDANQYFLVENRQLSGYDAGLWAWFDTTSGGSDAGGLAIWHIDESVSDNDTESHKKVDLEEANLGSLGYSELDSLVNLGNRRHYFYDGNAQHFGDGTTPSSRLYNNSSTDLDVCAISSAGEAMTCYVTVQPMGLLDWSTYLGHGEEDRAMDVAVDDSGYAYVTGYTYSDSFPTTPGAYQNYNYNYCSVFVTKFNKDGSGLVYSTFLNGGASDFGYGIAVDDSGYAYVTGYTGSSYFPTTGGAYQTTYGGGTSDAFVTKLNKAGSGLVYSTFLGGGATGPDQGYAIAIDGSGNAYVTGYTYNSDYPHTAGAFDMTYNGGWDTFCTKLNAAGSGLSYSTFLGATDHEVGRAIAVDGSGYAYVTGWTMSSTFPTTGGAYDQTLGSYEDAFVTKVAINGASLAYSTFLGGSGEADCGYGITVDNSNKAYVTGCTAASNFPTTTGAFDQTYNGGWDAYCTKLNAAGSALEYSTFLGGTSNEYGRGIAVDGPGYAYVVGSTQSSDFPTTSNAIDDSFNGIQDIFQVKLNAGGTSLDFSTYLGSSGTDGGSVDWPPELAIDGEGNAYIASCTDSADFPTTAGAYDVSYNGGYRDAVVCKIAMGMVDEVPPFAVDDLTAAMTTGSKTSGNIYLQWSQPYDNYGVSGYIIYRDTLTGGPGDSLDQVGGTYYIDSGTAGDTLVNYYYHVKAVDAAGNISEESNRAGEFDRKVSNGTK
jgi:M6 family metalloprotease-like protein